MENSESFRRISEYLKKNIAKGYTIDSLKWALINQGYPRMMVEMSIQQANKELAAKAPILKDKPVIKYEVIDEEGKSVDVKRGGLKGFFRRIFRVSRQ